jgi:hypothetical protein
LIWLRQAMRAMRARTMQGDGVRSVFGGACGRFTSTRLGPAKNQIPGINFFTRAVSAGEIKSSCLKPRFRLVLFLVRMCCLFAFWRVIFPVPVFLKRFAAPLWDFIFGMFRSLLATRCRR